MYHNLMVLLLEVVADTELLRVCVQCLGRGLMVANIE